MTLRFVKSPEGIRIAFLRFFVIIIILPTFFVQSLILRPFHGSSWNIRMDSRSTCKNKVFSAWNLVVSMETWKLRFSEHNFNCLVHGQFPTNFGISVCKIFFPWAPEVTWPVVMETMNTFVDFCIFVFWAIVDICFENLLPNLWDKILVVRSSIYWQLGFLVSMETWILPFNYFGLNECRPEEDPKKRLLELLNICQNFGYHGNQIRCHGHRCHAWLIFADFSKFRDICPCKDVSEILWCKTGCHGNQTSRLTGFDGIFHILIFFHR